MVKYGYKHKSTEAEMNSAIKILIADENTAERQALCNELRRAGFQNLYEASLFVPVYMLSKCDLKPAIRLFV